MLILFSFCAYLVWRIRELAHFRWLGVAPFGCAACYSVIPGATYGILFSAGAGLALALLWIRFRAPIENKWRETQLLLDQYRPHIGDTGCLVATSKDAPVSFDYNDHHWSAIWAGSGPPPAHGTPVRVVGVEHGRVYLALA